VLHGEDLSRVSDLDPKALGVPFRLEPWEPKYTLARYGPFPEPGADASVTRNPPVVKYPAIKDLEAPEAALDPDRVLWALVTFPERWVTRSHGEADGAHVRGSVEGAFRQAGHERGGLKRIELAEALRRLAGASAAGGGHGGRDGAVIARWKCWLLLGALADYDGPLPFPTELLGRAGREARFYSFVPNWERYSRWIWELHIGIERHASGEAWALTAGDTD
jgi:hypothetical protein